MVRFTGRYSSGRQSGAELMTCTHIRDSENWCRYPIDQPLYHVYGESFEELHLKLHKLYGDLI
jgi:hypothetical protein